MLRHAETAAATGQHIEGPLFIEETYSVETLFVNSFGNVLVNSLGIVFCCEVTGISKYSPEYQPGVTSVLKVMKVMHHKRHLHNLLFAATRIYNRSELVVGRLSNPSISSPPLQQLCISLSSEQTPAPTISKSQCLPPRSPNAPKRKHPSPQRSP